MAKPELGTKRVCPDTGRKFYDLNKTPVISPYTGKIVPIAAAPTRGARPETAATARKAAAEETEVAPESTETELVSLEDADAEQQSPSKAKQPAGDADVDAEDEDVELDESLDDAAFIEEEEEGDEDVTDIIGDGIEKEDES